MGDAQCVECGEDTSYCFCNPRRNRNESLGFHLPDPVQEYRDLQNKKLPSDLKNQDFSFTRLPKKKLRWKNMSGADLTGADLTGADLTRADLTGANLTGANLTKAHLNDTNLTVANLTGANLTDEDLEKVILSSTIIPDYCKPV